MSSRGLYSRAVVGVLTLVLALGCSLRTGDKGEPKKAAQFGDKFTCLSNLSSTVNRYVAGQISNGEVVLFFDCLKEALKKFEYYSAGQKQNGFTPQELVNFLNPHFLSENKINAALTREAMNIKVLLTGGSADFITRAEFERFIQFIDIIGEESVRHLPFVALYGIGSTADRALVERKITHDQAVAIQSALKMTAQRIAAVFTDSKSTYRLDSLRLFIDEIRLLLNWQNHHIEVFESQDLVALIGAYKKVLTGTSSEYITPNDWQGLLTSSAELLSLVVEFDNILKKEESFQGQALENFIAFTERVFSLVQTSIQAQSSTVISFSSFNQLIDAFEKIRFLPLGLRASSIKPVWKVFVSRVLRDPTLPQGQGENIGLTTPALNEARKEFYIWADSQRHLSDLAKREFVFKGLLPTPQNIRENDLSRLFAMNPNSDPRVQHITYIVKNVRPLFKDKDTRVWMVPEQERERFGVRNNLSSLSRLNVFGSLMRLLIRGFATRERALNMSGVTIGEMENFYQTIKNLGTDLNLMDPRSQKVGIRSFREGNMFTFAGNGLQAEDSEGPADQHLLSFIEGLELLTFIWSGGQVRTQFYDHGLKACPAPPGVALDIFGDTKMDRACYFSRIADKELTEISNLPHMRNYMLNLKGAERSEFYNGLADIARIRCEDQKYVEQAELATISTILHYIEVLYIIYDRDRNGVLNGHEVMAAFPRFHIFLSEQVQKLKKQSFDVATLKGIFTFLAREGRFPSDALPQSIVDKAAILKNTWDYFDSDPEQFIFARMDALKAEDRPKAPNLSLTRIQILKVLAMLNGVSSSDSTPCAAKKAQ